jgi:hypothetical protein
MTLELRGDDIVLLDLPHDFTLPERFPVRWCPELKAFAVPRRHGCVPGLVRLLHEQGLVDEAAALQVLGRRAPRGLLQRIGARAPVRTGARIES